MVSKQNFRYRGPIESEKVGNMMKQTITALNLVIGKTQTLLDNTKSISQQMIAQAKRRGTS